mmetsp:Transcript_29018/g.90447  ORF Transcript_29018/g.90447 Transcript_29018/m.90447 type:complete len:250 (+) Transcript_29018:248-997(+)
MCGCFSRQTESRRHHATLTCALHCAAGQRPWRLACHRPWRLRQRLSRRLLSGTVAGTARRGVKPLHRCHRDPSDLTGGRGTGKAHRCPRGCRAAIGPRFPGRRSRRTPGLLPLWVCLCAAAACTALSPAAVASALRLLKRRELGSAPEGHRPPWVFRWPWRRRCGDRGVPAPADARAAGDELHMLLVAGSKLCLGHNARPCAYQPVEKSHVLLVYRLRCPPPNSSVECAGRGQGEAGGLLRGDVLLPCL